MATSPATSSSPSSSATPTFHAWPLLPTELKLKVLSHLLHFDETIQYKNDVTWDLGGRRIGSHAMHLRTTLLPLLATRNQQLARLAQETYYRSNSFCLVIADGWCTPFRSPREPCARQIRHLVLKMCVKAGFDRLDGHAAELLKRLVQPVTPGVDEALATHHPPGSDASASPSVATPQKQHHLWQSHLRNLHTLSLHIQIWDPSEADDLDKHGAPRHDGCCLHPAKLAALSESLRGFEVALLRARRTEVVVEVRYARSAKSCYEHKAIFETLVGRKGTAGEVEGLS